MRLSKTAYYADFLVYAIVLSGLILMAALTPSRPERLHWLVAFIVGTAFWTLLEYLLHCFVLHRLPVFSPMHAVHHEAPRAYVGTPTWVSLGILGLVFFAPTWCFLSFSAASGLTAGIMLGFLWYGVVHHVTHYRRPRLLAARMPATIRRHQRHHFSDQPGNFGVTIPLWDYVFGTVIHERPSARSAPKTPLAT